MNIVLIEDSFPIRRELARRIRTLRGACIVGEAAGEGEASELIQRTRPDLVLLDLQLMPGNGMNVLRQMRATGIKSRVLVLTHQPLEAYRIQCEALGVDGFHDKGTDIDTVIDRIAGWMGHGQVADSQPASLALRTSLDAVTSLPSRSGLLDQLDLALRLARRDGHVVGIFVITLVGVEDTRNRFGMQRTDDLLAQAAARLSGAFSSSDVVARLAWDGFSVIVTRLTSLEEAASIETRIVSLMQAGYVHGSQTLQVGCTVGRSIFPLDGESATALLELADHRSRYAQASALSSATPASTFDDPPPLLPRLHEAIERREFTLAFQPQVDLVTGTWSGTEALARWKDARRGHVSPELFIALAEENGLIEALSAHLFDDAMAEYSRWKPLFGTLPRLSLNVSALQVRPVLIDKLVTLVSVHGLQPGDIELEFTETAMLSDGPQVSQTLHALRELGFSLALDDFGIGYSSLSMLQRLPISTLKIDRSFVADITRSKRSAAIVDSMVRLARGLDMRVIAEGVETLQQRDMLQDMGCREIQGYLLARPMPAGELLQWARHPPRALACAHPA